MKLKEFEKKFIGICRKFASTKSMNGNIVIPKAIEKKNLSMKSISFFEGKKARVAKKPGTKNSTKISKTPIKTSKIIQTS